MKLRDKFKERPKEPCILVSMNFSKKFFTGLTVVKAMLGDIGVNFDKKTLEPISDIHHLKSGKAKMTMKHNRSISGVFVFDHNKKDNHRFFTNPFADNSIPNSFFPEVTIFKPSRESLDVELRYLSEIIFYGL